MLNNFSSENCAVHAITWKNMIQPGHGLQYNMCTKDAICMLVN